MPRVKRLLSNPKKGTLARATWGSLVGPRRESQLGLDVHLDATYRWLCAAQDANPDGGVAGYYDLFEGSWSASYPETTGYIIPTFLALAELRSDGEARERALRMADWETAIQMEDGAVLSGLMKIQRGPAVFNTGQALFGWIAALEVTGSERYATAARAAAEWLVSRQDADGAWRRDLSQLTTGSAPTYNVRCAWALAYAGSVLEDARLMEAALSNSDWVLTRQNEAGWFAGAGFTDEEVPLLHTISYVIEGLLGVYAISGERRYLDAVTRALDPVVDLYRAGRLAGHLDSYWQGTVSWRCVTGDAQIAVVLLRLDRHCPGNGYAQTARRLIDDVAKMQLQLAPLPNGRGNGSRKASSPVSGGVPGSSPIWGNYMRFACANWAAKFYLDALLLEVYGVDEKSFGALSAR